jgi:hypothetical protein
LAVVALAQHQVLVSVQVARTLYLAPSLLLEAAVGVLTVAAPAPEVALLAVLVEAVLTVQETLVGLEILRLYHHLKEITVGLVLMGREIV